MISIILKYIFFIFIIRPIILVILGLNVRRAELLPQKGPAIVVANHNSHLDTMVLMTLFPLSMLPKLRPIAAGDYFLRNKLLKWFSLEIIGIIPIARTGRQSKKIVFHECNKALRNNDILIFFPEGTRGEPEAMVDFKKGISHLLEENPDISVHPLFLHGLGKALPKGEGLLVPFFCDVFAGAPLKWQGDRNAFMQHLNNTINDLKEEGNFPLWK